MAQGLAGTLVSGGCDAPREALPGRLEEGPELWLYTQPRADGTPLQAAVPTSQTARTPGLLQGNAWPLPATSAASGCLVYCCFLIFPGKILSRKRIALFFGCEKQVSVLSFALVPSPTSTPCHMHFVANASFKDTRERGSRVTCQQGKQDSFPQAPSPRVLGEGPRPRGRNKGKIGMSAPGPAEGRPRMEVPTLAETGEYHVVTPATY